MAELATPPEAPPDCSLCPRLVAFREVNRSAEPAWFNAPVPSFGSADGALAVVGLAPGLRGANRTGRPFTGDYAGDLLYRTLADFGFGRGCYDARPDDGFTLVNCLVTNAVRCVPPENKPTGSEISACRPFLRARLKTMQHLRAILVLGRIAHDSTVTALNGGTRLPFAHGARHTLKEGLQLFDSYHCSRYNTNTGRLTEEMFRTVVRSIRSFLDGKD